MHCNYSVLEKSIITDSFVSLWEERANVSRWNYNVGGFLHQDQHLRDASFGWGNKEKNGVSPITQQLYYTSCVQQIADM